MIKKNIQHFARFDHLVMSLMNPLLCKKAGIILQLLEHWSEIVGDAEIAQRSRPVKIIWPNQRKADSPFQPGILLISREDSAALKLQHQADIILQRIHVFFGYIVVSRLKFAQGYFSESQTIPVKGKSLKEDQKKLLEEIMAPIADPQLRSALLQFGESFLQSKN